MARLSGLDAVVVEAANRFDHRVGRMAQSMNGLHRAQEGLLVPRAAPLAAVAPADRGGVVDWTRPDTWRGATRSAIACMTLGLIRQAAL